MVCCDLNVVFTAESQRTQSRYFFHLPVSERPANENPQPLRAVIYIKLAIRGASKDAMNAILPEGLLFFTFWPLSRK
jgi:hypothetical protein